MSIAETFRKYYFSLAENLVLKLSKPPNNFGIQKMQEMQFTVKIEWSNVFKTKNFDESKVPDIDYISEIFLNGGTPLLATPIAQLSYLEATF